MTEQSEVQVWRTVKSCRLDLRGNSMHIKESRSLASYWVKPIGLQRSIVRTPTKRPPLSARKTDSSSLAIADAVGVLSEKSNALDVQDVSRGTALHRAAWKGQEELVSNLLNQKVDQHTAGKYGQLPMHLAAERGHVNVVKALMTQSTEINQRCIGDGQNALHRAAWSGSPAVVRLLAAKSVLDFVDKSGQTALHVAAALSYLPVVSLLLQRGAKVNVKNKRGWTPMAWAARNGDEEIVKTFLQHSDIEINSADELGRTPLHLASWYGHTNAVDLLLKHPAIDRDTIDIFGRTPVFHANLHGHLDVVQALSDHSRFGPVRPLDLPQASHSEAGNKCHAVVDYLLQYQSPQKRSREFPGKGSPDRRDENSNLLLWAASWGHYEIVEYLLHCGVYPDPKAESLHPGTKAEIYVRPESPLQLAARNGDDRLLKLLLRTGEVNINYWKDNVQPALFSAIRSGNQAAIGLLLGGDEVDLGCDDFNNSSALIHAANTGNPAIFQQVLATGRADNKFGGFADPLAIAALRGHEDIARLLLSIPEIEVDSDEALRCAAESGHVGVVKILLETGKADINAQARYRLITPLMGAAERGHHAVVSLLLSTGKTDLSVQGKNGETALSLAGKRGHDRIVKLLLQHIRDVNVHNWKVTFEAVIFEGAWYGLAAVVKGLLEIVKNVQLDPRDSCLRTPLIYAAMFGALDFTKALLSSGRNVDINAQDECLRTPLSYAAERGHESVVVELLALGDKLDINLKNSSGYTPLCYATLLDFTRVANRLWSTGRADLGGVDLTSIRSPNIGQPPIRGSISLEP